MGRLLMVILCIVLVVAHIVSLGKTAEQLKRTPKGEDSAYVMPAPILKITALEFDGLASDFMFLKALVFLGSTSERKDTPRVKAWEWKWLYTVLDVSTDLDPYFLDPYYVANAIFPWSAGLVKETNTLLEKGSRYREWDWMLPFFIGFNKFYFLQETDKASKYLIEASRRPGGNPLYASLAARLAYKGKKTKNAILFLEEIVKNTENQEVKKEYETRIEALKAIQYLETAVVKYKAKFRKAPVDLSELLDNRVISNIPQDPYGGSFYLDFKGNVKTTSDFMLLPQRHR